MKKLHLLSWREWAFEKCKKRVELSAWIRIGKEVGVPEKVGTRAMLTEGPRRCQTLVATHVPEQDALLTDEYPTSCVAQVVEP